MVRLKRPIYCAAALLGLYAHVCPLAQMAKSGVNHTDSRIDVYGGYGLFHPIDSSLNGFQYQNVSNINATLSVTAFLNRYVGIQAEGGYFQGNGEHLIYQNLPGGACSGASCNQLIYTVEGGPVVRYPLGPFVPFVHALAGGVRQNGPVGEPLFRGAGLTAGLGMDWVLPPLHHRIALRLFQADYQYSEVVYGNPVLAAYASGFQAGKINALKITGGVVVRFGEVIEQSKVQLGCLADPVRIFPGDPVKITGSTLNLNPRTKTFYTWTAKGTTVSGNGPETTVNTNGLAPGEYEVTGQLTEGPKGRELASCSAPFTVKPFEPPTISCWANPNTVSSGTDVIISTSGGSPQNRPLTYSYSATAGQITSNGPTAKLTTAGLSPSTITATCNVVDDLGQKATTTTTVEITAPVAPVIAQTQQLCSLRFVRDKNRPVRVDNEAKGCLDDIALTMNQQADARLILVGHYMAAEKETAAAERDLNARQYLTKEKGIDPTRIQMRIGSDSGKTVDDILVPAGAFFNDIGTHPFDESTVVRHGQAYGLHKPNTAVTPAKKVVKKRLPSVSFAPNK